MLVSSVASMDGAMGGQVVAHAMLASPASTASPSAPPTAASMADAQARKGSASAMLGSTVRSARASTCASLSRAALTDAALPRNHPT